MNFNEMKISEKLKKVLVEIGYELPTKIQEETIPYILEGRDIIGQSQTGTGKTASFGLPILTKIDEENNQPQAIIMCPTRELAVQATGEMEKFSKYLEKIKILSVYGGQDIEKQIACLRRGVQVVIGTPGRIKDHLRRKTLKLDNIKMVVLDEADEMLNMGFEEDMEIILASVPKERQTILFSATMNTKILKITKKYIKDPVHIKIQTSELTVNTIEQIAIETKSRMKDSNLMGLLEYYKPTQTIVFCNTKRKVDELVDELKASGYRAEALHGDIKQSQRTIIMRKLKADEFKVLVATDVAARGIDIKDLELVVNYDIPKEDEYYVHRIGRTGRNGKEGRAITFFGERERGKLSGIERYTSAKIKIGSMPTEAEISKIKNAGLINKVQAIIDKNEFRNSDVLKEMFERNGNIEVIAKALFTMLTEEPLKPKVVSKRSSEDDYRAKRELRELNGIGRDRKPREGAREKNRENLKKDSIRQFSKGNLSESDDETKLFLNVGVKDDILAKDIVGSIAANSSIPVGEIGKINVMDKFSFLIVPTKHVSKLMFSMEGKQIKGKDVNIEIARN